MADHTYGRGYAWALVGTFTALSVVLNGAHAVLGKAGRSGVEQALAALVAVVAPVSLLLATELVVRLIRDWSRRRRWLTALRGIVAATTAVIAVVAFATSFVALMDMAGRMGVSDRLAWALPVVVDAMIVIATLAVVVAEAELALDRADALVSATSKSPAGLVDGGPVEFVDMATSCPTAPVDERAVAFVEEPVGGVTTSPVEFVDELPTTLTTFGGHRVEQALPVVDEFVVGVDELVVAPVDGVTTSLVDTPAVEFVDGVTSLVDEFVDDLPDDMSTDPTSSSSTDPTTADAWRRRAVDIMSTSRISADVDELTRVLELDAAGTSKQQIADEVGRSRSTISGWLKAVDEQVDDRPRLAAVR